MEIHFFSVYELADHQLMIMENLFDLCLYFVVSSPRVVLEQEIWNCRHQQSFLSWLLPTLSSPWRTASSASWSLSSSVSTYSFNTSTTPEVGGKPSVNPRVVLTASASFSCSCTHSTFSSSTGFSKFPEIRAHSESSSSGRSSSSSGRSSSSSKRCAERSWDLLHKRRKKRRQSQKLSHGFVMKMVEKKIIFYLSLGPSVGL